MVLAAWLAGLSGCNALFDIEQGELAYCADGSRVDQGGCDAQAGSFSSASSSGGSGCLPPWEHEDHSTGRCYLMESIMRDWPSSRQRCLDFGGDLAAINSAVELAFVGTWMTSDAWIGGTDAAVEGKYTWTNGEPWVFSSWIDGEPKDPGGNRYCVALRVPEGALPSFDARMCGEKRAVLCESLPASP